MNASRVAGWASFCAWVPVTVAGLLLSFSILVIVGLICLTIGGSQLVASVRASRGSEHALSYVLVGALVLLGWLLVPPLFVAHSTPEGIVGWAMWSVELALVVTTLAGGVLARWSAQVSRRGRVRL